MSKFEVYPDRAGKWRWRLKANNGYAVATGEAFMTKATAIQGVRKVQRAAEGAEIDAGDDRPFGLAEAIRAGGHRVTEAAERVVADAVRVANEAALAASPSWQPCPTCGRYPDGSKGGEK